MSNSTHAGLSAPFSSSEETISRNFARERAPPHLHIAAPPVFVTAVGVGSQARQPGCFIMDGASWFAFVVGVANQPEPISDMDGADCSSRNAMPFRIVPDLGQVPENSVHPETKQAWDVLHDDEARSKLANESGIFRPKAGTRAIQASSSISLCDGDVLAREATADDINSNSICGETFGGELSNVVIAGDLGPMTFQNLAAERIDLAERHGAETARAFQPEAEATDSREQVQRPKHDAAFDLAIQAEAP
jgi:hypothetical protein